MGKESKLPELNQILYCAARLMQILAVMQYNTKNDMYSIRVDQVIILGGTKCSKIELYEFYVTPLIFRVFLFQKELL